MQNTQTAPQSGPQAQGRPSAARMPKAQALRIVRGLRRGVIVGAVVAFGGLAALVAGNVTGVTAQSSNSQNSQSSDSSSGSSQSGQNTDQNNSNFFGSGSGSSVSGGSSSQQPAQVTHAS
jgi:hypothetical protein